MAWATSTPTQLEDLLAQRGLRAIRGEINPWDLVEWKPAVQGIRTQGQRRLEDLIASFRKTGISGPAAGTLLERSGEATGGNILDLANTLRQVPESYIGQGLQAEETAAGRQTQAEQFAAQMGEQRKMRKLQEKTAKASSIQSSATGSGCCFIFIEGEGEIIEPVRIFRDRFFNSNSYVAKGYRRMASWLVPLMKRNKLIKQLVRNAMTQPMSKFAKLYYSKDRKAVIYAPVGVFWCFIWGHSARLFGVK